MRVILFIFGFLTLTLGLLWYPLGVGEYGGLTTRVYTGYRVLVAQGIAREAPSVMATLLAGVEHAMARDRLFMAGFLVLSGFIQILAAIRLKRSMSTTTAPA